METITGNDGLEQFQIEFDKIGSHFVELTVYEVISWIRNESTGEYDVPGEREKYLRAYMKWDGCYHFWFGDSDGYMHLCGNSEVEKHIMVMNKCVELAKTKIKDYNPEVAR